MVVSLIESLVMIMAGLSPCGQKVLVKETLAGVVAERNDPYVFGVFKNTFAMELALEISSRQPSD